MKEFKRTVFEYNVYGEKIQVKKPTRREVREKFDGFDEKSEQDKEKVLIDFLDDLGMKKELTEDMELEHLQIVLADLTGQEIKKLKKAS